MTVGYKPMSYDEFVKLIRPAFHKEMEPLDIEAILRRTTILVNTNWFLYVRPAGTRDEHVIDRHNLETKCFIKPSAKAILTHWWDTTTMPNDDELKRLEAEEQDLFRRALYPDRFQGEAAPSANEQPAQPNLQPAAGSSIDRGVVPLVPDSGPGQPSVPHLWEVKEEYFEEVFYAPNRKLAMEAPWDVDANDRKVKKARKQAAAGRAPTEDDDAFSQAFLCEKAAALAAEVTGLINLVSDEETEPALPPFAAHALAAVHGPDDTEIDYDVFGFNEMSD